LQSFNGGEDKQAQNLLRSSSVRQPSTSEHRRKLRGDFREISSESTSLSLQIGEKTTMSTNLDKQLWDAVKDGTHGKVKRLVKVGDNENFKNANRSTLRHQASDRGDLKAVRSVVISLKTRKRTTIMSSTLDEKLWDAVRDGEHDEAQRLVKDGANVNFVNVNLHGFTPLHQASKRCDLKTVRLLVNNGADVDCKDNYGWTPAHVAGFRGHLDAAFVLIDHGADLSIKNNDGKTALDVANNKDVASKLRRKSSTLPASIRNKLKLRPESCTFLGQQRCRR
jgi:ankyrin repeat protein